MAADFHFRSRDLLAPVRRACACVLRRSTDNGEVVVGDMESSVRGGAGTGLGLRPQTTETTSLTAAVVWRRESPQGACQERH